MRTHRLHCALMTLALGGCFALQESEGGGQDVHAARRIVDARDVALPPGYRIESVVEGLTFPTALAFDDRGRPHVIEAGYSYGEVFTTPRLLRIEDDGTTRIVAEGEHGPWNGLVFADGAFYVSQGGVIGGGEILRITPNGAITPLVEDLPSVGDHHTNGPAYGPDGKLYFAIGTATNSAVVGPDNAAFGWLYRYPEFHDIPGRDVVLRGKNFESDDPLTEDRSDKTVTGAFQPFGQQSREGQVVPGRVPCTGCVLRISPRGGPMELVAWGLRNPYGLGFSTDGQLYVTENSYDVRGSRPVFGTGDVLWAIEEDTWYGWPDFFMHLPLTHEGFEAPGEPQPGFLLAEHPNEPPEPAAVFGVHASANGFDVSTSERFGHVGELFVAQFGDMAPGVGKVLAPVGYKVVRVDPRTGIINDFAVNEGETNGPASKLDEGGLERPNDTTFGPDGSALYVVDFGVMTVDERGPHPREGTGVVWKIVKEERHASR